MTSTMESTISIEDSNGIAKASPVLKPNESIEISYSGVTIIVKKNVPPQTQLTTPPVDG